MYNKPKKTPPPEASQVLICKSFVLFQKLNSPTLKNNRVLDELVQNFIKVRYILCFSVMYNKNQSKFQVEIFFDLLNVLIFL